ncbi:MAG: hypothetical protein ABEL76_16930 [Bradymonadaceae bacterium]
MDSTPPDSATRETPEDVEHEFKRELSDLLDTHLGQVGERELGQKLDDVSRDISREGADALSNADEFERELSDIVDELGADDSSATISRVLSEVAGDLNRSDLTPDSRFRTEGGEHYLEFTFGSAFSMEQKIEELLSVEGFTVDADVDIDPFQMIHVVITGRGLQKSVTLDGRIVQIMGDTIAVELDRPDEETEQQLEKLPDLMRLQQRSEKRRQSTATGVKPLSDRSTAAESTDTSESSTAAEEPSTAAEESTTATSAADSTGASTGPPSTARSSSASQSSTSSFGERSRPVSSGSTGTSTSSVADGDSDKLRERFEETWERVDGANNWFEVLGLLWAASSKDVHSAYKDLQSLLTRIRNDSDTGPEQSRRADTVEQEVEKAYTVLQNRKERTEHRRELVGDDDIRSAIAILENKLNTQAMRSEDAELDDTCRKLLELDPDHEMASELLYG